MYKILHNHLIAEKIYQMKILAPLIPENYKPGQFIVLMLKENSERIPLTIAATNQDTITVIYQVVGYSTDQLSKKKGGDFIFAVLGPLGQASEIKNFGKIVCIGGGVGTAVIYPEIQALKNSGNYIYSIIGARTKKLLILTEEIKKISDQFIITTDDGSEGEKGTVLQPLGEILQKDKIDLVIAIGPIIMMKFVAQLTLKYNVRTIVSLNPIMVDATGMCGACRVIVDQKTKFACVDGPEFDAHLVDFDNLLLRSKQYSPLEKDITCRSKN